MLKMTVIAGAIGGLIVLAITPFVLRFATLNDTAIHYLKYMLLINTYYIMGAAVNTALIAGVFRAGGDTKFGLICDTIDMWCYAIPLGFFAAFVLKLPVLWVYFLLCTDGPGSLSITARANGRRILPEKKYEPDLIT